MPLPALTRDQLVHRVHGFGHPLTKGLMPAGQPLSGKGLSTRGRLDTGDRTFDAVNQWMISVLRHTDCDRPVRLWPQARLAG